MPHKQNFLANTQGHLENFDDQASASKHASEFLPKGFISANNNTNVVARLSLALKDPHYR